MGSGKKSGAKAAGPVGGVAPAGAAQGAKKVRVFKLADGQVRVEVIDG